MDSWGHLEWAVLWLFATVGILIAKVLAMEAKLKTRLDTLEAFAARHQYWYDRGNQALQRDTHSATVTGPLKTWRDDP